MNIKNNYKKIDGDYLQSLISLRPPPLCTLIAGVDEVGRGSLAGPVVAASVALSFETKRSNIKQVHEFLKDLDSLGVNDSKKLSSQKRRSLIEHFIPFKTLFAKPGHLLFQKDHLKVKLGFASVSAATIDNINVLKASLKAMKQAVLINIKSMAPNAVGILLVDGINSLEEIPENIKSVPLTKGDQKSSLIGLASIFAKEYRDSLMKDYALSYPCYRFEKNAGYPTSFHKKAIQRWGISPLHRKSFRGVK